MTAVPQEPAAGAGGPARSGAGATPVLDMQLASVGAVALSLFVLVKCYAVAKFSLTTASALLTTAPLTVLLGTLTSYAYQFFPLVALAALAAVLVLRARTGWSMLCTLLSVVAGLALLLSPWQNLWPPSLLLLLVLGGHALLQSVPAARRWTPTRTHVLSGFFLAAGVVVVLSTLTDHWLPVETITVRAGEGREVVVAHVLTTDNGWTVLVRAHDRGLAHVRSDDVLSRRICHLSGAQPSGRGPLLWTLQGITYDSPNLSCQRLVDRTPNALLVEGSLP